MKLILKPENNAKSWLCRAMIGPATVIDGIVSTITLSTFNFGLKYKMSQKLAKSRYNYSKSSTKH